MSDFEKREFRKNLLKKNIIDTRKDEGHKKKNPRQYDKRRLLLLLLIPFFLFALYLAWKLYIRYAKYTNYTVVSEIDITKGSVVGYAAFEDGILKYSKDGVMFLDKKGREVWIESYEMKSPIISVNGNYAAVADKQGSRICIFDKNKKIGEAKTVLPINRIALSAKGVSAVIMEGSSSSKIGYFKKSGENLDISVETVLKGDGYPVDISLSPDGTQLIAAFQYIDGADMRGRVVFYDFSEKGKSVKNRVVGGVDEPFANSLIAKVQFINNTYSYAVADTGIYFFSSKNLLSPELIKQEVFDAQIMSICRSRDKVALIIKNRTGEFSNKLLVFKASGEKILEKEFDYDYKHFDMDEGYVFLYNDNSALIYNMSGVEKYRGKLDFKVVKCFKGSGSNEFVFIGAAQIKTIRLK